jgi:hypothetical protein
MRHRVIVLTTLVLGLIGAGSTEAKPLPAKRIMYPVKITLKTKTFPVPDFPGLVGETTYGRVTSPKPGCVRNREVTGLVHFRPFTEPPHPYYSWGPTDSAGRYEFTGEAYPRPFDLSARVDSLRLGPRRYCAEATSAVLRLRGQPAI